VEAALIPTFEPGLLFFAAWLCFAAFIVWLVLRKM
jgi:hypothetical protein